MWAFQSTMLHIMRKYGSNAGEDSNAGILFTGQTCYHYITGEPTVCSRTKWANYFLLHHYFVHCRPYVRLWCTKWYHVCLLSRNSGFETSPKNHIFKNNMGNFSCWLEKGGNIQDYMDCELREYK